MRFRSCGGGCGVLLSLSLAAWLANGTVVHAQTKTTTTTSKGSTTTTTTTTGSGGTVTTNKYKPTPGYIPNYRPGTSPSGSFGSTSNPYGGYGFGTSSGQVIKLTGTPASMGWRDTSDLNGAFMAMVYGNNMGTYPG